MTHSSTETKITDKTDITDNLQTAMLNVHKSLPAIEKDKTAKGGVFAFNFTETTSLLNIVLPLFRMNNLRFEATESQNNQNLMIGRITHVITGEYQENFVHLPIEINMEGILELYKLGKKAEAESLIARTDINSKSKRNTNGIRRSLLMFLGIATGTDEMATDEEKAEKAAVERAERAKIAALAVEQAKSLQQSSAKLAGEVAGLWGEIGDYALIINPSAAEKLQKQIEHLEKLDAKTLNNMKAWLLKLAEQNAAQETGDDA